MAEKQIKEDLQALQQIYEFIPEGIEILQTTTYTLEHKSYESCRELTVKQPLRISQHSEYLKLYEIIQKKGDNFRNLFYEFSKSLAPKYSLGDQYQEVVDIEEIETVGYTAKPTTWKPKPGMITVVNVWESTCISCQYLMQNYKKTIPMNEHWKGKVEIVGLSCDELPYLIEAIKLQEWEFINHYRFVQDSGYQNLARKGFHYRLPNFVILNENGKIVYMGTHEDNKPEEAINKYLKGEILVDEIVQNEIKQQVDKQLIDKSEFKKLKFKLRGEIQEYLKSLNIKCQYPNFIKLELVKQNQVTSTGKIPIERSIVKINYSLKKKNQPKVDQLIAFLQSVLIEGNIIVESAVIIDKQQYKDEAMQFIKQLCEKSGVKFSFQHCKIDKFRYEADDQTLTTESKGISKAIPSEIMTAEVYLQIYNGWCKSDIPQNLRMVGYHTINQIEETVSLSVGDKFVAIDGYKKQKKEEEQIAHKQGQILVIQYCTFVYEKDISPMYANNQMLVSKKQAWGDSVRFVALTQGEDWQSLPYLKKVNRFMEIEQYYPLIDDNNADYFRYNATDRPYFVIVDKEGKIAYMGKQLNNMEEFIGNLINPKQNIQEQQIIQQQVVTLEQIRQLKQLLSQSKDVFKGMGEKELFKFNLNLSVLYQSDAVDAECTKVERPTLSYWVRSNKVEQLNKLLSEIYKIVPKECFKVDETISQLIDVPFPGKECTICKVALNDQIPQYYSPFKNEFVCETCADYDDKTQIGAARFKYIDSLVFINAPLTDLSVLKEIDSYKFGNNLKILEGEVGSQMHEGRCQGCSDIIEGPRYIVISTLPGSNRFDRHEEATSYCSKCFAILKKKNSEEAQKLIKESEDYGMCTDGLFLRVLFDNGYYDF